MRALTLARILLAAALAAGCYGTASYDYGYGATVSNAGYAPDLVVVAPGVQVIADYDEPIFFHDGFYWRFYGNTWYRSTYYTGGWVFAPAPSALLGIAHPHTYVHYRPQGWTPRRHVERPIVRDHRDERPIVRDHREDRPRVEPRRPEPRRAPPAPPAPPPRGDRDRDRDHRDHRDHRD